MLRLQTVLRTSVTKLRELTVCGLHASVLTEPWAEIDC